MTYEFVIRNITNKTNDKRKLKVDRENELGFQVDPQYYIRKTHTANPSTMMNRNVEAHSIENNQGNEDQYHTRKNSYNFHIEYLNN